MKRLMSVLLVWQLKATATLQSYNYIFQEDLMKKQDQERRVFFHRNLDMNVISQVSLLLKGHGNYHRICDREFMMVTNLNQNQASGDVLSRSSILPQLLKIICVTQRINWYMCLNIFSKEVIGAPSNTKYDQKATGCTLIALAESCLNF